MKQWLFMKHNLSPDNGLQMIVNKIWSNICLEAWSIPDALIIEIQSCPDTIGESRKLASTGFEPNFVKGSQFQTALDSTYVKITLNNIIVPVCHPEIQLGFINVPHEYLLDSSIMFVNCDRNTTTTECCDASMLPTNVVDIYNYNCNSKINYNLLGYSEVNSCHLNFTGSGSDNRQCIEGPLSFIGYSVCNNVTQNNMVIPANEFRYLSVDRLDAYPDAINYLLQRTKDITNVIELSDLFPMIIEHDGDIIITDLDTNLPLHLACGSISPESINCKTVDCTKCVGNTCTGHNHCIHGCKNDIYLAPECVDVKPDSQHIAPKDDTMCYCFDGLVDRISGVEYCTGEELTEYYNVMQHKCFKEMRSPSLSLSANSNIVDLVLNTPYSKVLIVSPTGTLLYIDIPSFPLPCKDLQSVVDYEVVDVAINSCNCSVSLCDHNVCTNYGGCTIGCKDKNYMKPWCNQTIASYTASLLPHHPEQYDEPDVLSSTNRNLIVYILSGVVGLITVIFGMILLLLGVELPRNKAV